ncbi:hypothetical protein LIER_06644 [Lithospermum erythrorhizon]|uniref:Uncharacterized protein n=1 Tax=Lithospermum erythrorhizon TaxID=34254 RepID=A0AAV3P5A6_LITER
MKTNEITQEKQEEKEEQFQSSSCIINSSEDLKTKIRRIIEYQKSLHISSNNSSSSSLSSSTLASSSSSLSTSKKTNSLISMMKAGNTSLRRLFEMEHTSLSTYLREYSSSPLIKPILLWGSDSDNEDHDDPWLSFRKYGSNLVSRNESFGNNNLELGSQNSSFRDENDENSQPRMFRQKLSRKKTFRRLPGVKVWRFRGFRFLLRLNRLKIIICCRNKKNLF